MDNKLSELSKPAAWVKADRNIAENWSCTDPEAVISTEGWHSDYNPAYSQEYVSALLAELEAKTKHISDMEHVVAAAKCDDELWDAMAHRLKTLEAKLATPVRLQSPWVDKVGNRWLLEGTTAEAVRAAGFKVEGDEQ